MAGDWIKMRTDMYRHPKVCLMADSLMDDGGELARFVNQNAQRDMTVTRNVMRNVTVGALVSVWGVLRHRGERVGVDLVVKDCTPAVLDDIADLPGFGAAMESVGWVQENQGGIVLPRFFDEMNIDPSEEAKEKNAERQRRHRQKKQAEGEALRNVTVTLQSNAREEKRREEKSNNPIVPSFDSLLTPPFHEPATKDALESWIAYLATIGKPALDPAAAVASIIQAFPDPIDLRNSIHASIGNQWRSLQPVRKDPPRQDPKPEPQFKEKRFRMIAPGVPHPDNP